MNLQNRFRLAVQVLRGKTNPVIAGSVGYGDISRGLLHTGNYEEMAKNYRSWVYACANVIGRNVARVPLRLYVKRKVSGKTKISDSIMEKAMTGGNDRFNLIKHYIKSGYEVSEIEDHPFLDLLKSVNPMENSFELWEKTSIFLDTMGNCYWYFVKNQAGLPGQIWILMAQFTKVVPDGDTESYIYQPKQKVIKLSSDEVVHYKYPSLTSLYYGYSPMQAGAYSVDSDRYQKEFEVNLFKHGALPGVVLETERTLGDEAYDRLDNRWNDVYAGVKRAGKTAILEEGLKAKKLGLDPQELSFMEGRKLTREEILCIYGVPLTMLGFGELTNRSTAESLEYAFMKGTILPKLTRIQEKINEQVMPVYDEKIFAQFDNPIPRDIETERKERETNLKWGVTTINEERKSLGLAETDWGKRPYMPLNLMPVGAGEAVLDEEGKGQKVNRDKVYFDMWMDKESKREREFQKGLRTFFRKQGEEIKRNLEDVLGKKDIEEYILFDMDKANIELTRVSRGQMTEALKDGVVLAVEEAGLTISVDVVVEQNQEWINNRLETFVQGVNGESAKKMAEQLRLGLNAGENIKELSKRVDKYYDYNEKYRSMRIARTESAEAMGEGIMQGYREGGITYKRWLTQSGCCELCDEMDGKIVEIESSFGEDAFGGEAIHPPIHPNCRCTIVSEIT